MKRPASAKRANGSNSLGPLGPVRSGRRSGGSGNRPARRVGRRYPPIFRWMRSLWRRTVPAAPRRTPPRQGGPDVATARTPRPVEIAPPTTSGPAKKRRHEFCPESDHSGKQQFSCLLSSLAELKVDAPLAVGLTSGSTLRRPHLRIEVAHLKRSTQSRVGVMDSPRAETAWIERVPN